MSEENNNSAEIALQHYSTCTHTHTPHMQAHTPHTHTHTHTHTPQPHTYTYTPDLLLHGGFCPSLSLVQSIPWSDPQSGLWDRRKQSSQSHTLECTITTKQLSSRLSENVRTHTLCLILHPDSSNDFQGPLVKWAQHFKYSDHVCTPIGPEYT